MTKSRGAILAVFALAVSLVVACGHQVTPPPSTSDLSGDVVVRFRVNGTLDFNDFTYGIIVDTCGEGTPYPQYFNTTFNSYSYGFYVGASYGVSQPQLVEYFLNPASGSLTYLKVPASSSLENFNPNDNGLGNEFELVFTRAQLANPLRQSQPCPNLPPVSTSPTPTASAGASPTATPSSTSTFAPSASPSPYPYPTTAAQTSWAFNFFTIQSGIPQDSLGYGGASDINFSSAVIDTTTYDDVPIFKAVGGPVPGNPALQLSGGEIINYP